MGLDNAASRSSYSSSSKNPCEGSATWWWDFDSGFGALLFEETTTALEELVVRFKLELTAVVDETVRGNGLERLDPDPDALATWSKNNVIKIW